MQRTLLFWQSRQNSIRRGYVAYYYYIIAILSLTDFSWSCLTTMLSTVCQDYFDFDLPSVMTEKWKKDIFGTLWYSLFEKKRVLACIRKCISEDLVKSFLLLFVCLFLPLLWWIKIFITFSSAWTRRSSALHKPRSASLACSFRITCLIVLSMSLTWVAFSTNRRFICHRLNNKYMQFVLFCCNINNDN